MEQQCNNCGQMNPSNQNFCTNCGKILSQSDSQGSDPVAGFTPVSSPPPYQGPAPQQWQQPQAPPYADEWQNPAPGSYQPVYPPQYPPYQQPPAYGRGPAKSEFEESKGLFMSMINAHKADADPASQKGELPPRKYPALKLLMTLTRVMAWINAIGLLLTGIVGFFVLIRQDYIWWVGLIVLPVVVILALLGFTFSYAIIDALRLLINTEDNTRRAANK